MVGFQGTIALVVNRPTLLLLVLGATSALCGCVAISSVQTADTLGAGRLQVGIEPGVAGVIEPSRRVSLAPAADVAVRYGATDRLDVGGRFGQSGLELQLKLMVTPPGSRVAVSVAPHLAGQLRVSSTAAGGLDVTGQLVNLGLPVLIGLRLGAHQLVLGPRLHLLASVPFDTTERATRLFAAGGSVGVALQVSRAVAVMPELALVVPLSSTPLVTTMDTFTQLAGGVLVQARLAFLLGASSPPP